MKKIFFAITLILALVYNGKSQWYTWKYGVKDINELSQKQLEQSLTQASLQKLGGFFLMVLGPIPFVKGISEYNKSIELGGNLGEGKAYSAVFLIGGAVLMETVGVAMLLSNNSKIKEITKAMNRTQIGLGFTDRQLGQGYCLSNNPKIPVLSLTFNF
jgi:hypothetical protein